MEIELDLEAEFTVFKEIVDQLDLSQAVKKKVKQAYLFHLWQIHRAELEVE